MKTLLIGYADDRAQTVPIVVAGPEKSGREQAEIFAAAKTNQRFPQGIARLELIGLQPLDLAIAVAPKTTPKNKKKD